MLGKKLRLAMATSVAAVVAAVSFVALPAAPAMAAQCVNLTGATDWDGWTYYAEVKNICSGTYHFGIKRSDGWTIGCNPIEGYVFAYFAYKNVLDVGVKPTGIKYC
jgi:hypothetical protein